jgi:hypothetical protein
MHEAKVILSDHAVAIESVDFKRSASTKKMIPTEVKTDRGALTKRLVKDVHADLTAALRGASLLDNLDYFEMSIAMKKRENAPFPNFEWISCAPVSNEGYHYVYIGTVSKGRHNLIFVGKTSKGFQAACEVANMCAHELKA